MKANKNVQTDNSSDNFDKPIQTLTWMASSEAASYLRISVSSLRNMVSLGQIRSYKLGRRLRFKKVELDKAMLFSNDED